MTFIIDSKYTSDEDGQRFWFVPSGKSAATHTFPYLIPKISFEDDLGHRNQCFRKDMMSFASCSPDFRVASIGRRVSEFKGGRESLAGYQEQVLGALSSEIHKAHQQLGRQAAGRIYANNSAHFFIPIIATNAPLFMLRSAIVMDEIMHAKTPSTICEELDYLLVELPNLLHLKLQLRRLYTNVKNHHNDFAWECPNFEHTPVVFCRIAALEGLVSMLISGFANLSEKA